MQATTTGARSWPLRHAVRRPLPRPRTVAAAAIATALVGTTLALPGPASAVTQGDLADAAEYPFMVALQSTDGEQFCGGSILSTTQVVTAAHCVEGERPRDVQVAAGMNRLGDNEAQVRQVSSIQSHPGYARTENEDVAVLTLTEPFDLGGAVQAIALADNSQHADLLDHGSPATTIGWGATSERGGGSRDLLEAELDIVGDDACQKYDRSIDPDTMLCAGSDTGQDSCYGDSGGPLIVHDDHGRAVLAGIVSFGLAECGGNLPGVYADVAGLREFILGSSTGVGGDPAPAPEPEPSPEPTADPEPAPEPTDDWDDEDWADDDWDQAWGDDWDDWDDEDWDDEDWDDEDWDGELTDQEWFELEREVAVLAVAHAQACLDAGGSLECIDEGLDQAWSDLGW